MMCPSALQGVFNSELVDGRGYGTVQVDGAFTSH